MTPSSTILPENAFVLDDQKRGLRLTPRSPFTHPILPQGKQTAGLVFTERNDLALIGIGALGRDMRALASRVKTMYGIALPDGPAYANAGRAIFIGLGPGQWLAAVEATTGQNAMVELALKLGDGAVLVDQSDAKCVLRLSGPPTREVLMRGLPLDLHSRAFQPGCAAQTVVEHISVLIWQVDDAPTYDIAVPRSYAESFWRWLTASAAPYGVLTSDRG
ncbi:MULTISPECIES: sarcosine oxidase subunit gamma family protein [unclassified Chelatococcus]|uniref:sarcosine oxidase subunit gamma n=1 Tax=unclassified Chelatococcus TaxID=2638111 RepID=UPI0025C371C7|nr:sarcosine oxidase subunit gamma family protein [Chelatococcus sp.]MCO5075511.1 sarcosine oxidase subunit gamma [Chelatococcus sp.]